MIQNHKNKLVVRAYPTRDHGIEPMWDGSANQWAYSLNFLDWAGPAQGGYSKALLAVRGGLNFLTRMSRILPFDFIPDDVVREYMFVKDGKILTKNVDTGEIKTQATIIGGSV